MKGYIRPTIEIVLTESSATLRKHMDAETGKAGADRVWRTRMVPVGRGLEPRLAKNNPLI